MIEQMETTEPRTVGARFNLDRMQFLQDHGSGCPEREVSAKPTGQASVSHEQEGNKRVLNSAGRMDMGDVGKPHFQLRDPARDSKAKMLCSIRHPPTSLSLTHTHTHIHTLP